MRSGDVFRFSGRGSTDGFRQWLPLGGKLSPIGRLMRGKPSMGTNFHKNTVSAGSAQREAFLVLLDSIVTVG